MNEESDLINDIMEYFGVYYESMGKSDILDWGNELPSEAAEFALQKIYPVWANLLRSLYTYKQVPNPNADVDESEDFWERSGDKVLSRSYYAKIDEGGFTDMCVNVSEAFGIHYGAAVYIVDTCFPQLVQYVKTYIAGGKELKQLDLKQLATAFGIDISKIDPDTLQGIQNYIQGNQGLLRTILQNPGILKQLLGKYF